MRILGTEPSSVILCRTKQFHKLKCMPQKCQNKLKPKGMALETHNNTISVNFNTDNLDALKTLRINRSRPWNLAACALGVSLVDQQWHSSSSWNIKRDFFEDVYTILNRN